MIIYILLLGLALRLWNLNQSLWLDEAAQAIESSQPIPFIWGQMQADFHPPLFNLLLHFWLGLGTSEVVMRILPLLFGLGTIIMVYLLAKELFNKRVALISALFLSLNPFHIYFSQELRSYVVDSFLATLSAYLLWKCLHEGRIWWLGFCLSVAVFFYTAYFAAFLLIAFGLFLILQKKYRFAIRNFLISVSLAAVLFLPWVPQIPLQLQISQGFAADLPGWKDAVATPVVKVLPLTLVKFIIGQINIRPIWLYALVSVGLLSLWGFVFFRFVQFKDEAWKFLIILVSGGLVLPALFSFYLQIASPKRLIFVLPFLIILLAYGLSSFKGALQKALFAVIISVNIACIAVYQFNPNFQREDWRTAVGDIEKNADNKSIVIFKFSAPFAPYLWYSHNKVAGYGISPTLAFDETYLKSKLPGLLTDKDKVFVFQYIEGLTDKQKVTEREIENLGFRKVKTSDYPGVGFVYEYIR